MMSIIDVLLETDREKLKNKGKKTVRINRLSEALKTDFAVECACLTHEQVEHISEISKTNTDIKINTIIEACKIESKKLNNKELIDKFKCASPYEFVKLLFLPGELYELYSVINDLSGYGKDVVSEIKNS